MHESPHRAGTGPTRELLQEAVALAPGLHKERREEASLWRAAFCEDYRCNIAMTQMHQHKDTCFKYVIQQGIRKAKHCRFHFNHFVALAVRTIVDGVSKVCDIVFARTGKDLVLPRSPGEAPRRLALLDEETGDPIALRPAAKLGPTVISDISCGMHGRVQVIR